MKADPRLLWMAAAIVVIVLFELAYLLVLTLESLAGISLLIFVAFIFIATVVSFSLLTKNNQSRLRSIVQNLFLLLFSVSIIFVLIEGALKYLESNDRLPTTQDVPKKRKLVMPAHLKRKTVAVEGSEWSYYWRGVLHAHKYEGFRRSTVFPEKQSDTVRIVVLGDSLTYGYGIDAEDTYASLIESGLSTNYRTEVLNLKEYAGRDIQLHVNQWEGHPNEIAHRIFSDRFIHAIEKLPV